MKASIRWNFLTICLLASMALPADAQPRFTDVAAEAGLTEAVRSWGASWVDYDGDGDLDLFASRQDTTGGNRLFRNTDGLFAPVDAGALTSTSTPGSLGHSWADYDNDGDLDVYAVGGWLSGPGHLFRNDGGTFSIIDNSPIAPAANNLGWTAAWGDVDGDGRVDLIVAHPAGFLGQNQPNHFFRNEGNDAFARIEGTPVTDTLAAYTVASWSDYDLDGDPDLFIGSGPVGVTHPDNLYENQGDGSFTRITEGLIATDARDGQVMNWQDIDNDGDLDLFVTNFRGGPQTNPGIVDDLYINNGDGSYRKVTEGSLVTAITGTSLANTWGDIDNDGDLDVFVSTGGNPGIDRLYLNDGAGRFTLAMSLENGPTSGATFGDYDDDGDLDLAVTTQVPGGAPIQLYRNDTAPTTNWLKLNLIGTASNRAAIGAKVYATATIGGKQVTQMREVSAQNTFNGQNALTVHFGLGDANKVDELRVVWPSGTVDVYQSIPANVHKSAREGDDLTVKPKSDL